MQEAKPGAMELAASWTWLSWFLAHTDVINGLFQFIVLLIGAISGSFAIYWHVQKWRNQKRGTTDT